MKNKIYIYSLSLLFLLILPIKGFCLEKDFIFKAKVVEILEEKSMASDEGIENIKQNIKLIGLEGPLKDENFVFYGVNNLDVIGQRSYSPGERVLVTASFNSSDNSYNYYITDYIRNNSLLFLLFLFLFFLILIGHWKGFRSILSLGLTFIVIIFFIIPKIMAGFNPVFITALGALFILFFIIYLTEGLNIRSHLAVFSTFISLILVIIISYLFIYLTKLSGAFSEDVFILINIGQQSVNLKGLLLAGMIIGSLGVLDDVIISQTASVEQIMLTDPYQNWKEVFKKAYKIGISHISSMTNTLFLAYAGASLPLLILFISPDSPFNSFEQIINNEAVSTEIVRALSGSLGIVLAVPIATIVAVWGFFLKKRKAN
ncbi:MAG: YibE/F family protein [Patescibacteria group bacterium]|jgi:uncharacterized membrane protein